jgi:hypothetical protein
MGSVLVLSTVAAYKNMPCIKRSLNIELALYAVQGLGPE